MRLNNSNGPGVLTSQAWPRLVPQIRRTEWKTALKRKTELKRMSPMVVLRSPSIAPATLLGLALALTIGLTPVIYAQASPAVTAPAPNGTQSGAQSAAAANPTTAATPSTSNPILQPSPTVQLRSLEPSEDEEYTLGGGDELNVTVAGHPELSGKQLVGPDGRVTLATAGTVNLNNLTREQANTAIEKAMAVYYRDPAVTISIDKYGSNRVMVTGAVQKQGYIYFQQTPTLLDAITQAGLLQATGPAGAQSSNTAASTGRQSPALLPQECKVYEGTGENQKMVTVNLHQLMNSGNGLADLRLRRNAVVFVENPRDRFVSVLGEVTRPGPVVLADDLNLPEILSYAGGLTEKAGGNPNIAIVDPATRKVRYIRYKDAITPGGMNEVTLQPGDLIVVPKAGLAKAGYIFQQLGPVTGFASIFALAAF